MPQLNPAPWLAILVFSWLIFAVVIPPKVLAHVFPNNPGAVDSKSTKTDAWTWPWH
nr:ATP synthase F0 subunit 8 [Malacoctenus triangulatus]